LRARETVENEALGIGALFQHVADHADHHLVRHQFAGVHQGLGLQAEGAVGGDLGAQQVAGAQVLQP
jgi:hypothetical protein